MKQDLQTQLVRELVIESLEGLDSFDSFLLAVEKGGYSDELLNNAFRVIHTIKGSSGCLGLASIEHLAHAGENLMAQVRDGKTSVSGELTSVLFRYSDALRAMLRELEEFGEVRSHSDQGLIESLQAAQVNADALEDSAFGFFEPVEVLPVPRVPQDEPPIRTEAVTPQAKESSPASKAASESVIRVDIGQIDKVMNLVGELVLARNQIVQFSNQYSDPALGNAVQRVNLITTELQENVMKTRMQPIESVWSKFPRIVRDLCHELGKDALLQMEGQEVELDRTIIEAIKDPLTHIVRNAVDHGIESAEKRALSGKPAQGTIRLRAYHEGGQVNIEISDDGKGIDPDRLLRKAVQRGLISPEQSQRMSEREIKNLIFLPGFSTADAVTNVSGRGVGMDVVKTNIEKIGGSVEIQSQRGLGTVFRLKIPLTLAIIPALLVTSGGDRYAIPQASLLELVRIEGDQVAQAVEFIHSTPVFRLRGKLLPLVDLNQELELGGEREPGAPIFLVVLQAEGKHFGLMVDAVNDTEEIVVKPLGRELSGLPVYAGATIMGDGHVALILDVLGIARRAGILTDNEHSDSRVTKESTTADETAETASLLLVEVERMRFAIPLSNIARLEEIPAKHVENTPEGRAVRYRGQIMPLIGVASALGLDTNLRDNRPDPFQVVVCREGDRNFGLVIDTIEDIVHTELHARTESGQPGIEANYILQDRVTSLMDVEQLIRQTRTTARKAA